ncbi:MAG: hypothetical protein GY950_03990 [bacterium]|nr:hypothetical protein [bacterium]
MKDKFNFRLDNRQIECLDDAMVEIYRKKTPVERIKIASDMWDSAWLQLDAVLRSLHPDWDNDSINKEIIRRLAHHESL